MRAHIISQKLSIGSVGSVLSILLFHAPLYAQTPFYQGKTIRIVVGSTTGGGYDLWARVLARYYGKYIPGNPTILVQNMPGAASIV
ncbi:MAG: efflux transporter protein, partial [Deltaproteobacteria bacterium]|nr:efflux transporter protein [Deltaproteobacteria bacterium]